MNTCSEIANKNPRRRIRRIACFLLCLMLVAGLLPAAATAPDTGEKTVRVGWYESAFNKTNSAGRRSGYAYEYQMKIAAHTGWRYEYVEASWPELLQMLIRGEIDLMSDVSYTEERSEQMLFASLPMGAEDYYLFTGPENTEISASDYSTLNGKKVGVNQGSIQAEFFRDWAERNGVSAELVEVTGSEEQSLHMLKTGELDAYVTVDSFTEKEILNQGRPVPICKIGSSDFFFAVNKDRPDLLADLEGAMNRIQEENRYYTPNFYLQQRTIAQICTIDKNKKIGG